MTNTNTLASLLAAAFITAGLVIRETVYKGNVAWEVTGNVREFSTALAHAGAMGYRKGNMTKTIIKSKTIGAQARRNVAYSLARLPVYREWQDLRCSEAYDDGTGPAAREIAPRLVALEKEMNRLRDWYGASKTMA